MQNTRLSAIGLIMRVIVKNIVGKLNTINKKA
jgi:hypothetical protein